ncbi:MAG TPA: TlpA disulfide reductase family protein [Thermoanaerobaculia bacterium]
MRKVLAVLLELATGLILVAALAIGVLLLLQSRSLVFLFLPLLAVAAMGLGSWRGRARALPPWLVVALLNLPMALVVWYTAGRARVLLLLPLVSMAFAAMGIAAARGPAARGPVAGGTTAPRPAAWRAHRVALPALAVAVVVLGAMGPRFARSLVDSHEVREPPVSFELALPAGAPVAAAQLRGRIVVIDFWATWCGPCQHELPELEGLYRRFSGDPRVVFYAVDFAGGDTPDDQGDTPARASEYFRRRGFRVPLAYDAGGRAAKALHAHGLPTLLVLDRAGRVRLRHVGFVGAEDLGATLTGTLQKLLAEGST